MSRRAQRLPREERLTGIVAAARAVLETRGYGSATMAEIAHAAGIAEPTLYKFFASKQELMEAVVGAWYEDLIADIEANLAGISDPVAQMRWLIWRHIKTLDADPGLCRVVLHEVRTLPDYDQSPVRECNRRYTAPFVAAFKAARTQGLVRADLKASFIRDAIYGALEHHLWDSVAGKGKLNINGLTDQMMGLFFDGLFARDAGDLSGLVRRLELAAERLEPHEKEA